MILQIQKSRRGITIEKQDEKIIVYKIKTPNLYPVGVRLQQTAWAVFLFDELSRKWTHNATCYIRKSEFHDDNESDLDKYFQY